MTFIGKIQRPLRNYLTLTAQPVLTEARGRLAAYRAGQTPVRSPLFERREQWLRRSIDIAVGLLGTAMLSPVVGLGAWLVRRESPGPVFFWQERIGYRGEKLQVPKLRTLKKTEQENAETHQLKRDPGAWRQRYDGSLTRSGRFLRILGVDELPQLSLVLSGQMTLFGLRAMAQKDLDIVQEPPQFWLRAREEAKPALIPYTFVVKGDYPSNEELVGLEMYYLARATVWNDLKLLPRTILTILAGGHF